MMDKRGAGFGGRVCGEPRYAEIFGHEYFGLNFQGIF